MTEFKSRRNAAERSRKYYAIHVESKDLYDRVKVATDKYGTSMAEFTRTVLTEWLDREGIVK